MKSFAQSFFGSIATGFGLMGSGMDFIPKDNQGGVIKLTGNSPQWCGLGSKNMQFWAYSYCAPLSSVIDRLAEADINGVVEILTADDKKDYDTSRAAKRILAKFKKPNSLQSWGTFRGQQIVFKKTFGWTAILCVYPEGMDKSYIKSMWNLNPYYLTPVYDNESFSLYGDKPLIKQWDITIFGTTYHIPAKNIIILRDGFMDNQETPGLPMSKVHGLDWAVSNLLAAMEADNVLLKKRGPLGFISHDPRPDSFQGTKPMEPEDKTAIQQDLQQYGMTWSQFQYVISPLPIKWNPMSFNIRDLMTKETCRQSIDMICDRLGHPAELMSGKNATYENRSSAEKYMYNTNVVPASIRDFIDYDAWFGFDDFNIGSCFTEFPLLQEDAVKQGESEKAKAEANEILWLSNMITRNQYLTRMGIDTIEGGDIYYNQWSEEQSILYPNTFAQNSKKDNSNKNETKKPSKD